MKKLFGKYLKEQRTDQSVRFYWYQMNGLELIALFICPFIILYLLAFYFGWKEIFDLKILPLTSTAVLILFMFLLLVTAWIFLNRKATLTIEADRIILRKRPFTGSRHVYRRDELISVGNKLQSQFYESDTGMYPDIYTLYIYLTHSRQVKIGGFNQEDSKRIIEALGLPVHR